MFENLKISFPTYFLILILVGALVFAFSLYYKDQRIKENKTWLPKLLGLLRFISVFGILFLLLTPLIKNFLTEKQKPVIVIATDKSASIESSTASTILDSIEIKTALLKSRLAMIMI